MSGQKTRYSNPWVILLFLMAAVMLSFIDRQILSVVVDPIRKDLAISDFQVGLLGGPIFIIFYICGNLLAGWAADRRSRVGVISVALVTWSCATALCGFASSFVMLVSTRAGVGFGEGGLGPGVHSVVADTFDKKKLPLALSIYSISGAIGPGLALLLGGLVLHAAPDWFAHIPLLQNMHPWQQTFVVVGLPGVLWAGLLYAVVRVPRRRSLIASYDQGGGASLVDFWRERKRLAVLFITAIGFLTAAELSLLLWLPTLLMRLDGFSPQKVGATFGTMLMVLSAAGSVGWGLVSTTLARRGHEDAALTIMTLAMTICVPFLAIAPLMPSGMLTLVLLVPVFASLRAYSGLGHATVQLITPTWLRGRVAGIYLAAASAIGALLGPPVVGAITTYVFPNKNSIGIALSTVSGTLAFLGVILLTFAFRPYRNALALLAAANVTSSERSA